MKLTITLLGLLSTSFFLHAQADSTAETVTEKSSEQSTSSFNYDRMRQSFLNLPKEEQEAYIHLQKEANRLYSKQRFFESLTALYQMRDIFKGDPYVDNHLALVNIQLRDFDKAQKHFGDYALSVGENSTILFNQAEVDFCSNNWDGALEKFNRVLKMKKEEYDKAIEKRKNSSDKRSITEFEDLPVIRIVMMKKLLSHIALRSKGVDTKKHEEKIQELSTKYDFMDDSPYYYYANAALEFAADNNAAGDNWLVSARKVYSATPSLLSNWDDTFKEFGFIRSVYGISYK